MWLEQSHWGEGKREKVRHIIKRFVELTHAFTFSLSE